MSKSFEKEFISFLSLLAAIAKPHAIPGACDKEPDVE